ncbi:MAG TPA: thiamine phosphate synthase, partial [Terriglobia bacterium]|nr:thiamine phosphate synthase [Terriglobia bacterium]
MQFSIPRLYAIIDPDRTGGATVLEAAEILLAAGVRLIQYRDKGNASRQLFSTSSALARSVHGAGGTLIVNDRADVALAAGADGVHLGQEDLPVALARRLTAAGANLIGCSTHTVGQVREADPWPVDYIAFGPVFATRSKAEPDPVVGLEGLRAARQATSKPLVAIGGISLDTARSVVEAGADSVA